MIVPWSSYSLIKPHTHKSILGAQGLFQIIFQKHSLSKRYPKAGTQDRNSEARTEAEPMEECWQLSCSSWFNRLAYLKDHQSKSSTGHSYLDPHTSIFNHKNSSRENLVGLFLNCGSLF